MFKKPKGKSILGLWMVVMLMFSLFGAADVSAIVGDPTIAVTQGAGGTITPDTVTVSLNGSQKFTISPDSYYHITDVQAGPTGAAVSVFGSLKWSTTNKKIAYYTFTNVTEDKEITATFAIDTKRLTIQKFGPGGVNGTVTGTLGLVTGIDCGVDCTEDYPFDTDTTTWPSVVLTATNTSGSIFKGWYKKDGTFIKKTNPWTITMNKNQFYKAKFIQTYTLSTSTDGDGTGTVSAKVISGQSFGGGVYLAGSVLTLKETPALNSRFDGWAGDATGTTRTYSLKMNGDKSVTATFNLKATALQMPDKVKVVDAAGGVTAPRPTGPTLRAGLLGALPEIPPDSDYYNDPVDAYVEEQSTETFNTINEILCSIGQTKYDEMTNWGPYQAQIDKNLCSSGKDDPSSAGEGSQDQSSGSTKPNYEMWTIVSSRASDAEPQNVKVWIHQPESGSDPPMLIYANAYIYEGVSDTNPFGRFKLNFKGNPVVDGQVVPFTYGTLLKGFLRQEKIAPDSPELQFSSDFNTKWIPPSYGIPAMQWTDQATLNRASDGSTGEGTVYLYEYNEFGGGPYEDDTTFDLAYEPNYFLKRDRGDLLDDPSDDVDSCLDRNTYIESVWSYGLYHSDTTEDHTVGSRVSRNSGFPIKFKDPKTDKIYYGWIGYWGIWFPKDVNIKNGAIVTKFEYSDAGATGKNYTVQKSGGKLKKHVRNNLTLGEIKNVPLDYFVQSGGPGPGTNYRVTWDGLKFSIFSKLDTTTNMWGSLAPEDPTEIDLTNLTYDMLYFYSQALSGQVQVRLSYLNAPDPEVDECTMTPGAPGFPPTFSCLVSDSTPVVFYSEDIVYPGDTVPETLHCFNNCPDAADLAAVPDAPAIPIDDPSCDETCQTEWATYLSWTPFNDYSSPQVSQPDGAGGWVTILPAGAEHQTYTLNASTHVLQSLGTNVLATKMHPNFQWGYTSGPLFDEAYLDILGCEMVPENPDNPDSTCGYRAWGELPEFYTWETGSNDWNQFTALKDPATGLFEKFDPPLQVKYVHYWDPVGDPTKTSLFYLEYSGFGNLWGIPGHCVDREDGTIEVPCGEGTRWIPQFSIPDLHPIDGTPNYVTDGTDGVTLYYVKALQKEQMMKTLPDLTNCIAAGLTITEYPLLDLSTFEEPNIGAEPVVSGPPKVIGGVIQ